LFLLSSSSMLALVGGVRSGRFNRVPAGGMGATRGLNKGSGPRIPTRSTRCLSPLI
jgi:hypothetical protein